MVHLIGEVAIRTGKVWYLYGWAKNPAHPRHPDCNDNDAWWFGVAKVRKKEQLHRTDAIQRLTNKLSSNAICNPFSSS